MVASPLAIVYFVDDDCTRENTRKKGQKEQREIRKQSRKRERVNKEEKRRESELEWKGAERKYANHDDDDDDDEGIEGAGGGAQLADLLTGAGGERDRGGG